MTGKLQVAKRADRIVLVDRFYMAPFSALQQTQYAFVARDSK